MGTPKDWDLLFLPLAWPTRTTAEDGFLEPVRTDRTEELLEQLGELCNITGIAISFCFPVDEDDKFRLPLPDMLSSFTGKIPGGTLVEPQDVSNSGALLRQTEHKASDRICG